jgi:hypothetical protein
MTVRSGGINGDLKWYPASSRTAWFVFGGASTAILIGFTIALIRDQKRSARRQGSVS